jgi:hypothetical protein
MRPTRSALEALIELLDTKGATEALDALAGILERQAARAAMAASRPLQEHRLAVG